MADNTISYELDLDGTNPDNFIQREPHFLTEIDPKTQNALIPNFPPFHLADAKLETALPDGGFYEWQYGVDYELNYPWYSLQKETGKWVYGGFKVHRKPTAGIILATYRTLGKPWIANRIKVLEALANYVWQPRIIQFDQITNIQETFPPNQHGQDLLDFTKWDAVVGELNNMTAAMLQPVEPTLLFQQQVIFMRESYDGLRREVSDMQFQIDRLWEAVHNLQNP